VCPCFVTSGRPGSPVWARAMTSPIRFRSVVVGEVVEGASPRSHCHTASACPQRHAAVPI